jgi:hypothetical protein
MTALSLPSAKKTREMNTNRALILNCLLSWPSNAAQNDRSNPSNITLSFFCFRVFKIQIEIKRIKNEFNEKGYDFCLFTTNLEDLFD